MTEIQGRHNAILEDRSKLMLTGVNDVERFDENTVVLYTQLGELTVKGEKLHISELSVENGELNMSSKVEHETKGNGNQQNDMIVYDVVKMLLVSLLENDKTEDNFEYDFGTTFALNTLISWGVITEVE